MEHAAATEAGRAFRRRRGLAGSAAGRSCRVLRALLFVPGNKSSMLAKIPTLAADALILDLEDSVPPSEKENARALVREALLAHGGGAVPLFVRVNAVASGLTAADLAAVTVSGLSAVVHPKTRAADDIRRLDRMLADLEAGAGLPAGAVRLVAVVESPRGLLNAAEIAEASPRLVALGFGAEDFATDMHLTRTRGRGELAHALLHLSLAAHAAGIGAIDTVCVDVKDEEQLLNEAQAAKELGFTGKLAIHPRQVPGIVRVFSPSAEELEQARRVVEAFDAAVASGSGVVSVDGKMVDAPVAERFRRMLVEAGQG